MSNQNIYLITISIIVLLMQMGIVAATTDVSVSDAHDVRFEYDVFGHYKIISFGDTYIEGAYFVGYDTAYADLNVAIINNAKLGDRILNINLLENGYISKILIDSNNKYAIATGDGLELKEGYMLNVQQIDLEGNKILVELTKDGRVVDTVVLYPGTPNDAYVYDELRLSGGDSVPIIIARVASVFRGTDTNVAVFEGLFQISDTFLTVAIDDSYGTVEVLEELEPEWPEETVWVEEYEPELMEETEWAKDSEPEWAEKRSEIVPIGFLHIIDVLVLISVLLLIAFTFLKRRKVS